MPFKSPEARLDALAKDFRGLANPSGFGQRMILGGIRRAILRGPLREEFRTGIGPDGPWKETVRGKQALESKTLAGAFKAELLAGAVRFEGAVRRNWLMAHQLGQRFSTRSVEANKQFLTFNKAGRLIKNSKALNKKGQVRRGVFQTFAKAHTVGARVLPPRPMIPTGAVLPPSWNAAATAGAEEGLQRWMAKVAK